MVETFVMANLVEKMHNNDELRLMASVVWGEARGEPIEGQVAVASVIRNRRLKTACNPRLTKLFWATITDVLLTPWQFSCLNDNDPNREKVLNLVFDDDVSLQCLYIAEGVRSGLLLDNTRGADHYLRTGLQPRPKWVNSHLRTVGIVNHVFFKVYDEHGRKRKLPTLRRKGADEL